MRQRAATRPGAGGRGEQPLARLQRGAALGDADAGAGQDSSAAAAVRAAAASAAGDGAGRSAGIGRRGSVAPRLRSVSWASGRSVAQASCAYAAARSTAGAPSAAAQSSSARS